MIREFERDDEYAALNEVPPQSDFEGETPEIDAATINAQAALEAMAAIEGLYAGWGATPTPAWSHDVEPF